jgi:hypothetical protein
LRKVVARRHARGVIVSGKSSSTIDRTKSPSKVRPLELVGAVSTLSAPAQLELSSDEPAEE